MSWVLRFVVGVATLSVLFVLLTDGRYFGKGLMLWIYDRMGPAMFGARSEHEQWHSVVEKLGLRGDERVLDVGTAVGELPLTLAATDGFLGHVTGVDWSPRMIDAATDAATRRRLEERVTFQVADLRDGLPFEDGEFDVVFCQGLLETMPSPGEALLELRRVLAPTGTMVLSLYQRGLSSKVAALSLDWYERQLSPLGLGDVRVAPFRRRQEVVVAQAKAPPA